MFPLHEAIDSESAEVVQLAESILRGRRLTIASNRGPIEYKVGANGTLRAERGSGGVVTALAALSRYVRLTWIASAMSEGDRVVAGAPLTPPQTLPGGFDLRVRFVVSPPREYDLFYNALSNPVLWFVQHRLHDMLPREQLADVATNAWHHGYVPVNRDFARAIAAELLSGNASPVVMLHDYHLYLVARFLREQVPQAFLQQFVHIPWPEIDAWSALPPHLVAGMCRGLLANNIVGFQTRRSVDNFLEVCDSVLPAARVDYARATVTLDGQRTTVRNYPISIDVRELRALAKSPEVAQHTRRLRQLRGEQTIVRVDRLDPSKNVLSGFLAFDNLLARRPELRGKVKFLSFLVPSRTGIPEYKRYANRVFDAIETINHTYGDDSWQPIELFYENNYEQAVAAMGLCDVLMVNSSLDGMNLVSKEVSILNRGEGVLILSSGAGSHEELGQYALSIDPQDVAGTSLALERALAMPAEERRLRAAGLRLQVEQNDITTWLRNQIEDIGVMAGRLVGPQPVAVAG